MNTFLSAVITPAKIPFILQWGIPFLLIACVVIGVYTFIALLKKSIAENKGKKEQAKTKQAEDSACKDIQENKSEAENIAEKKSNEDE